MRELISIIWHKERFRSHIWVNGLLYYLRKFPLLGKRIPETIYQAYDIKAVLFPLFLILSIPLRILAKCFWLFLWLANSLLWINILTNSDNLFTFHAQALPLAFLSWLLFAGFSVRFSKGFETTIFAEDRKFLHNFQLSQKTFLAALTFVEPLFTACLYLPALIGFSILARNGLFLAIGLLAIPSFQLGGAALSRWLFSRRLLTEKRSAFSWGIVILSLLLIALTVYFYTAIHTSLFWGILIGQVLILLASLSYLKRFNQVEAYLLTCFEHSMQLDRKVAEMKLGNEYTRQGLAMQKKLTLGKEKDLSHLTGMAYLNALLFQRYRSILTRKLRIRLLILLVSLVGGLILFHLDGKPLSEDILLKLMPYLFMIMYALSLGRSIAQMVFVNCDIAMLHYPFYRQGRNIISGFNYRWMQSLKYNSCFALGVFIILLSWGNFHYSLMTTALLALLLTSLTLLLSFHDLFIYYLLQPFTKDMEVTNPVYKLLSSGLYWIAYFNMQIRIDSILYVYIVSALLLLYVSIGYLVLLKLAPKTFVIK